MTNQTQNPKPRRTFESVLSSLKEFFKSSPKNKPNLANKQGFMHYIFGRIEIILLILMGLMAFNLFNTFVGYIYESSIFIKEEQARLKFSTNLIGTLLGVEIVLALATAFFRNRSE